MSQRIFLSRCHSLFLLGLAAAWLAGGAESVWAVDVTISPQTSKWTISPYLLGGHFVYSEEKDSIYADGRVADWMKQVGVGLVRWPGGTTSRFYHWPNLTGVMFGDNWDPTWDPRKNAAASQFMDLDEYLAFCKRAQVEPMLGINVSSGVAFNRVNDGIQEAVDLVNHVNKDLRLGVRWFYLGNEEVTYSRTMTMDQYIDQINQYVPAMRNADPTIKIIVNHNPFYKGPDLKTFLPRAGKNVDVIEFHSKWGDGMTTSSLDIWRSQSPLLNGQLRTRVKTVRDINTNCGFPNLLVANNEWGATTSNTGFDKYQRSLMVIDYLMEIHCAHYDMACFWNTQGWNYADMFLLDATKKYAWNPMNHGFELMAAARNQKMVDCTSNDRRVYGFACLSGDNSQMQLFLINKDATSKAVNVTAGMFTASARVAAHGLMMQRPGTGLDALAVTYDAAGKRIQFTLPQESFSRVTLSLVRSGLSSQASLAYP
jgi:hypothetical protein